MPQSKVKFLRLRQTLQLMRGQYYQQHHLLRIMSGAAVLW